VVECLSSKHKTLSPNPSAGKKKKKKKRREKERNQGCPQVVRLSVAWHSVV
jgi:hypothetical protein